MLYTFGNQSIKKNDGHKRNHSPSVSIHLFWKGLIEIVYYMY